MAADLVVHLPLTADARRRAITAMATGRAKSIRIGQCSLHPDLADGWIWGVDPYGQDAVAATSDNAGLDLFERALDWAVAQHQRPFAEHQAERTHDTMA